MVLAVSREISHLSDVCLRNQKTDDAIQPAL